MISMCNVNDAVRDVSPVLSGPITPPSIEDAPLQSDFLAEMTSNVPDTSVSLKDIVQTAVIPDCLRASEETDSSRQDRACGDSLCTLSKNSASPAVANVSIDEQDLVKELSESFCCSVCS